jgi:uncharacterized membrane protein YgdD (TMEM256/DUF423 family)
MSLWNRRTWLCLAALNGLLAVGFGAFAAHGVQDLKAADWLRTASTYAFVHSFAIFAAALVASLGAHRARWAPGFFLAGALLFSGSLYAMALGAPRWLGAITPIGGASFMIGWAILAWAALSLQAD